MIITILWEDQRGAAGKRFGPHELLLSCVDDDLHCGRDFFAELVIGAPKKGSGKILQALKQDLPRLLKSGPVCAVLDRDRVLDLWPASRRPPGCSSGIRSAIVRDAPGEYGLVLLENNIESVVAACHKHLGSVMPRDKPSPEARDEVLFKAAWASADARSSIRQTMPTFDRIARWVKLEVQKSQTSLH